MAGPTPRPASDAQSSPEERTFSFVVVSNRLPVDRVETADGGSWNRSPGGLVTALEPIMAINDGAWVGWPGIADHEYEPFDSEGSWLVPVGLSEREVADYYEGFSNDTLWPLYHDVIAQPGYHRIWWEAYAAVNQRFAEAAVRVAEHGATVWVQDYQLQLVPAMIRKLRPDIVIGFFNHIPFPAYGIYSQLPWRRQILEGLLGADVIGFQRAADAGNFARAVRRLFGYSTKGTVVQVPETASDGSQRLRPVIARAFPISIETSAYSDLAKRPDVQERAKQIRDELGNPTIVMLGVDRLDYTKGIAHRMKAFGELLEDGRLRSEDAVLVQVASPSRERVETYRALRDEIELMVGRINGDFGAIGHPGISYLHHSYPREEMVAMFLAADVMLVTALRDGMNLVAKEYVASRIDNGGVLILSEFAGASDELKSALLINPHDIDGVKDAIMTAIGMPARERANRMRALRRRVIEHDVDRWSADFLAVLARSRPGTSSSVTLPGEDE
ncbi:alpha,alpha-trehalose-phosphate synthase (UDP-forming) [Naasia lichenicola]|uniref:Trehalose-6-phosphate synthase n=1 Tax=Naasia lichenicola TaxID=2565933 RepID=A0A4S4FMS6_9MICO|nr:trehalose-6-phosphate synthase [Naasia lichenicola]